MGAPGEVGVFAGSHVAHETLQEAGERLALARVDLRGGRLAPEPGPPEDAFHWWVGASRQTNLVDGPVHPIEKCTGRIIHLSDKKGRMHVADRKGHASLRGFLILAS